MVLIKHILLLKCTSVNIYLTWAKCEIILKCISHSVFHLLGSRSKRFYPGWLWPCWENKQFWSIIFHPAITRKLLSTSRKKMLMWITTVLWIVSINLCLLCDCVHTVISVMKENFKTYFWKHYMFAISQQGRGEWQNSIQSWLTSYWKSISFGKYFF